MDRQQLLVMKTYTDPQASGEGQASVSGRQPPFLQALFIRTINSLRGDSHLFSSESASDSKVTSSSSTGSLFSRPESPITPQEERYIGLLSRL